MLDKVALVTGAARRIGAGIAERLHAEGYNLILHFRASHREALALRKLLEDRRPESVVLVRANLESLSAVESLVAEAVGIWGRLDAVINNASAFYPTPLGEATETHWDELLASNLKAPFFLSQAAYPQLKRWHGCIVNLVDIYGLRPRPGFPIYSVAKAGLAAMTRSLALEMAPDVRVNGVAPGAILWPERPVDEVEKNDLLENIPLRRMGEVADIAKAVRYLVCDADYVTGQILPVDGGRSL